MKRKILCILTAILLVAALLPTTVFADIGTSGQLEIASTGLGELGAALAEAVGRQPEMEDTLKKVAKNVIIAAMEEMPDATDGLGALGAGLVTAIGRQPEAEDMLKKIAKNLIIKTMKEMPDAATGLGRLGGALMEAIGRQPEAEESLKKIAKNVIIEAMREMPWASDALGELGAGLVEAVGRQPEAEESLKKIAKNVIIASMQEMPWAAEALGKLGAALVDAIGRQPEANTQLKKLTKKAIIAPMKEMPWAADGLAALGVGLVTAVGRQPAKEDELTDLAENLIITAMKEMPESATGLGTLGGTLVETVGRQPESEEAVTRIAKKIIMQAMEEMPEASDGLGVLGAGLVDAVGRQPEAEDTLKKIAKNVIIKAMKEMPEASDGLGALGAGLVTAIGRQPEAEDTLKKIAKNVIIEAMREIPEASDGLGALGAGLVEAIGRQPEAEDALKKAAKNLIIEAMREMPEASDGLGTMGAGLVEAIGRQPEEEDTLKSLVKNVIIQALKSCGCSYQQAVTLQDEGGRYTLKLNGRGTTEFKFALTEDGGWSIRLPKEKDDEKAANGGEEETFRYLAAEDGRLIYSEEPFSWNYNRNTGFSTTQTVSRQTAGYWFLFWYIPAGTRIVTTNYYLTSTEENAALSTRPAMTSLMGDAVNATHTPIRTTCINRKDGWHTCLCSTCGEYVTERCIYNETTHRCVCGAYDPERNPVTVEVLDQGWTEVRGWFWTKYSVFTVELAAADESGRACRIEYSLDGESWRTGSVVTSNTELMQFDIRVTDANGAVNHYEYQDGEILGNPAPTVTVTLGENDGLTPDQTSLKVPFGSNYYYYGKGVIAFCDEERTVVSVGGTVLSQPDMRIGWASEDGIELPFVGTIEQDTYFCPQWFPESGSGR